MLTLEAKDSNGIWKPIEEDPHLPNCQFGTLPIKLLPNEIVLTALYKRKGNYNTKLRLKLGNHYSNEFLGNINPNLFNDNHSKTQLLKK